MNDPAPGRSDRPRLVLGVDTALRKTGYGIVTREGRSLTALRFGLIRIPANRPHSVCLQALHDGIGAVLEENRPDEVAIEGVFYCKNVRTALALGEARGVVIETCAAAGIPVYEHAPRRVKQAVVGYGNAHKSQVASMVARLLNLESIPSEDETDALGLAICHLQARGNPAGTELKPL